MTAAPPRNLHLVSLGCPKNRVDSEVMLGLAQSNGYTHVADPEDADVIVVNTCGFIGEAKEESIDAVIELSRHKQGRCGKLVVTGCLVQRYASELAAEMPEIDHLLGSSDMMKLNAVLASHREGYDEIAREAGHAADRLLVGAPKDFLMSSASPRQITTRGASAYVKIAEGCNRTCSFCVIPDLRGKQRSRSTADVVAEVERLVDAGVKEINLISQDTVAYGRDLKDGSELRALVQAVADVPGVVWVRLFYLYPEKLTDGLIELIAGHPKIVKYVDMPLQHASDSLLRRMRRGHGGKRLVDLVERMKKTIPDLTFRTAFIVGHPGEDEAAFEELCDFVRFAEFDRVGVFQYSDEETSKSFGQDGKVASKTAAARRRKLLSVQRPIAKRKNKALIGKRLSVLVEGASEEHEYVLEGRHAGQAPDIDGHVFLSGGEAEPGELRIVEITQSSDYDLVGELLEDDAPARAPANPANPAKPTKRGKTHLRVMA